MTRITENRTIKLCLGFSCFREGRSAIAERITYAKATAINSGERNYYYYLRRLDQIEHTSLQNTAK